MKKATNTTRYQKKFHVKAGDKVLVISGNSKGESWVVREILTKKDRVIVEGVNLVTKHVKPTAENPEGGIKKIEAGLHISNVSLLDPKTGEKTKIYRAMDEKSGKRQRYSKKTNQLID